MKPQPSANPSILMEKLVSLCKRRGFIYQSSEIYGGWNGFWDYGPLGAELKRNLRDAWWKQVVHWREDVVGLDASIIMHPAIWKASGHVDTFNDPMHSCPACKKLTRADQILNIAQEQKWYSSLSQTLTKNGLDVPKLQKWLQREAQSQLPNLLAISGPEFSVEFAAKTIVTLAQQITPFDLLRLLACPPGENPNSVTPCPHCGAPLPPARPFNLMLRTHTGPIADDSNLTYLRPETAQAIFAQFKNVYDSSRVKVPFGIAQIGKAFRNEITPRNFTFRSREFEQMELEFFIRPDEATELLTGKLTHYSPELDLTEPQPDWAWDVWHHYWVRQRILFFQTLGLHEGQHLELYWQKPDELAHYAKATVDILFRFPFGTEELEGIAARGDFDLSQHQLHSGKSLEIFEEELKIKAASLPESDRQKFKDKVIQNWGNSGKSAEQAAAFCDKLFTGCYIPHVIEPSLGLDRLALAVLSAAYAEDTVPDAKGNPETRTVLRLHPSIAPIKCAVLPLLKNKPELVAEARRVFLLLRQHLVVEYDEAGAIGRRYRRQDEIGTPFCVTIDFDTIGENGREKKGTVTVRNRDTLKQERIPINQLVPYLLERIAIAPNQNS
ncbi:MAG: glycine--tRNA ligase [Chthoniobacterales bacterium]|nr:glycine--tRNA ligase [Chthoniobacterales bacterium]